MYGVDKLMNGTDIDLGTAPQSKSTTNIPKNGLDCLIDNVNIAAQNPVILLADIQEA
jgi:hypothetical protein